MCSNCLTTTLPVECVCCSWSSLNASPYPGATVCIIIVLSYSPTDYVNLTKLVQNLHG